MKKKSKYGRNPKLNPKTHCVMVRFDDEEWNKFLTMYEESQVYAKAVFLKAHFFGQKFKVLKVDKTLVDYYTKLSDFHAQFREVYHRPCEVEPGDCGAFKGDGEVLPIQIRLIWHR